MPVFRDDDLTALSPPFSTGDNVLIDGTKLIYRGYRNSNLILEIPPKVHTIWYKAGERFSSIRTRQYSLSLPYVVFVCRPNLDDTSMYFANEPLTSLDHVVVNFPFPNSFYNGDGPSRICWHLPSEEKFYKNVFGDNETSAFVKAEEIVAAFSRSIFNDNITEEDMETIVRLYKPLIELKLKDKNAYIRFAGIQGWHEQTERDPFFAQKVDWTDSFECDNLKEIIDHYG